MLKSGRSYPEALFCGGKLHSWGVMLLPQKSGIRSMDITRI